MKDYLGKYNLILFEKIDIPRKYKININHKKNEFFYKNLNKEFEIELDIHYSGNNDNNCIAMFIDPLGNIRRKFYSKETLLKEIEEFLYDLFDIDKNIYLRKAYRALSEKKIDNNLLDLLIYSAKLAPSCANKQPWNFIVVTEKDKLTKLKETLPGGNYWAKNSPAILAIFAKKDDDCNLSDNREYYLFDTGMAVANILIQATKFGLIAHPIAGFDPITAKKVLNISDEYTLITLIILGYYGDISSLKEKHLNKEHNYRNRKE
ncbi:nitroreductase family protein [Marinitoga aeolica]|uniref:Nitroreductase family protein n=1 Tax=Marinitoga aeolica TaxID=2809031 RepID=A0ABY8PRQ8_9BACT|nr:nitroreductase family protein [Marinitoga aeolica]WGS65311.1 nitroreductase family protein [Marinitoga aeolica]